jgi:hypothetical protein
MLLLYPVLGQFISDDGPGWATKYYDEVRENKIDAKEAVLVGNVGLFSHFPICFASIALTRSW